MFETETELHLLEIARRDLKASKYLFKKKMYPQAVFLLQQSVEKAVKSLAIHNGILTKDKARRFGHNPIKVYAETIQHWKQLGSAIRDSGIREVLPELNVFFMVRDLPERGMDFEKISSYLEKASTAYKSVFLSKKEIDQLLAQIDEARDYLEHRKKEFDVEKELESKKEQTMQILAIFAKLARKQPEELEAFKKKITPEMDKKLQSSRKYLISRIRGLIDLSFCDISLLYLSFILLPHSTCSRYPVEKINPLEVYKKEFPLVKRYNKIASLMDEILAKITYSFSRVPKRTHVPKNLLYEVSDSIRKTID